MSTYHLNEVHGGTTHSGQTVEQLDIETMLGFGYSVMIIAAADGQLSDAERSEFLGMMTSFGVPPPGIEAFKAFDPAGKKLEDHLPRQHRSMIRHFLYDAIKVARADGYHELERQHVRKAAALVGVPESVVIAIEGLVEIEASVRNARLALLREGA
jgi:uncharacterized tellurite resistance protein B-like protein